LRSEPLHRRPRARKLLVLGLQYGRFALVGLGATLVHVLAYAGAIELWGWAPLAANAIGFALGVNVSFLGHRSWTFRGAHAEAGPSLARFWVVALIGFALNSLFVHLVTGILGLAYHWAIPLIAGVTPLVTFALSKLWAFRG
jgi:putative flippase GtrA